ncbi:MAG: hypothetical protein ACI9LM_001843 [Alteromonadaceae bacterium]|jgi:hypothetical protein
MSNKEPSDKHNVSDKELALEQQFADWLEGKPLSKALEEDDKWLKRVHTANYVNHQADITPELKVPDWDRGAMFESDIKPWWQWQGLPAMSMAFSMFAMALVLFKVELVFQPEGVLLSFAGSANKIQDQKIATLVNLRLKEFAGEQQVVLANYATDIQTNQQDSNLQLATYIMSASRQERKEDMTDFIQYINDQRQDEKFNQKIKFQELEQKIYYQKTSQRNDYDKIGSNQENVKTVPTNWNSEE